MTVHDFKTELEAFLQSLRAHQAAWRYTQGWRTSETKKQTLESQAHQLSRQLGRLRPYIYQFQGAPLWIMYVQSTGSKWNALDEAVSSGSISQIKGPSMQAVVDKLHELLGRLDSMNPTQELGPTITPRQTPVTQPNDAPIKASEPKATAPELKTVVPEALPPPAPVMRATSAAEPVTLDKLSVGVLFAGLRNLSIPAALTVLGIIGGNCCTDRAHRKMD